MPRRRPEAPDLAALAALIARATGASRVELGERVQELWGGYGEIRRAMLVGATTTPVIVKCVVPPPGTALAAPEARSHRRKLRSYEVERAFYRSYAARCGPVARVPAALHAEVRGDRTLLVLEDLDAAGFASRRHRVSEGELAACMRWLAHFHARFLGVRPESLWSVGTYWHVSGRDHAAGPRGALRPRAEAFRHGPARSRCSQASHLTWAPWYASGMATKLDLQVPVSQRDHVRGPSDARVTLVEYGDFDCPYCQAAQPAVRAVLKHFGPDLRFVFRQNPLGDLHQHARLAAQAAEAATLQGKFWPMYDRLFSHPKELDEASLARHAAALGLEPGRFAEDLHSKAVLARIREDEVGGLRSGVIGTPTFFIDGMHFRDKPDFDTLEHALEARLAHAGTVPKAPFRRRDGSGHLDPKYRAKLLAASGHAREAGDDHAFLTRARSADAFAEKLGEEVVETATSGEDEFEDIFNQIVPEENGGPFIETTGSTEFAHGTDASNIAGATREPFPTT